MNKIFLIGNLTRDPELTETSSGIAVCNFSIAVNRRQGQGEQQTDFFGCTAWRGLAETVAKYCKKGSQVALQGSLEISSYTDRDGNNRKSPSYKVREVEFLSSATSEREEHDGYGDNPFDDNDGNGSFNPNRKAKGKQGSMFEQSFDDSGDIPF